MFLFYQAVPESIIQYRMSAWNGNLTIQLKNKLLLWYRLPWSLWEIKRTSVPSVNIWRRYGVIHHIFSMPFMSSSSLVEDKEHYRVKSNVVKTNLRLPPLAFLKLLLEAMVAMQKLNCLCNTQLSQNIKTTGRWTEYHWPSLYNGYVITWWHN